MNPRRLYRSRSDRQLAGVAAGMAEYLDVDPTVVRILWIIAGVFSGGLMILAYIILAFVIPEAPFTGATNQGWSAPAGNAPGQGWSTPSAQAAPAWSPDWRSQATAEREARERSRGRGPGAALIVGTILVVFGVIALADSVIPGWVGAVALGPALVIALGAALLIGSVRRQSGPAMAGTPASGQAPSAAQHAAPAAAAPSAAPVTGAGYDVDATSQVDLGDPADPTTLQPETDPR